MAMAPIQWPSMRSKCRSQRGQSSTMSSHQRKRLPRAAERAAPDQAPQQQRPGRTAGPARTGGSTTARKLTGKLRCRACATPWWWSATTGCCSPRTATGTPTRARAWSGTPPPTTRPGATRGLHRDRDPAGRPHPRRPAQPALLDVGRRDGRQRARRGHRQRGGLHQPARGRGRPAGHGPAPARPGAGPDRRRGRGGDGRPARTPRPGRRLWPRGPGVHVPQQLPGGRSHPGAWSWRRREPTGPPRTCSTGPAASPTGSPSRPSPRATATPSAPGCRAVATAGRSPRSRAERIGSARGADDPAAGPRPRPVRARATPGSTAGWRPRACTAAAWWPTPSRRPAGWPTSGTGDRHWVTGHLGALHRPVQAGDGGRARSSSARSPTDTDDGSLWWRHEHLHRRAVTNPEALYPRFTAERDRTELGWLADPPTGRRGLRHGRRAAGPLDPGGLRRPRRRRPARRGPAGTGPSGTSGRASASRRRRRERPVDAVLDEAFVDQPTPALATTLAVLAVQGGEVVAERYADGVDEDTTLISWSMAKSITQALVGFAVADGLLDIHAPAPVPGVVRGRRSAGAPSRWTSSCACARVWRSARTTWTTRCPTSSPCCSARARRTWRPSPPSFPLAHPPGTVFNYSSGTTNILARIVGDLYGGQAAVEAPAAGPPVRPGGDDLGHRPVRPRRDLRRAPPTCTPRPVTSPASASSTCDGGTVDGTQVVAGRLGGLRPGRVPGASSDPDEQPYGAHWWRFPPSPGASPPRATRGSGRWWCPTPTWWWCAWARPPRTSSANLDRVADRTGGRPAARLSRSPSAPGPADEAEADRGAVEHHGRDGDRGQAGQRGDHRQGGRHPSGVGHLARRSASRRGGGPAAGAKTTSLGAEDGGEVVAELVPAASGRAAPPGSPGGRGRCARPRPGRTRAGPPRSRPGGRPANSGPWTSRTTRVRSVSVRAVGGEVDGSVGPKPSATSSRASACGSGQLGEGVGGQRAPDRAPAPRAARRSAPRPRSGAGRGPGRAGRPCRGWAPGGARRRAARGRGSGASRRGRSTTPAPGSSPACRCRGRGRPARRPRRPRCRWTSRRGRGPGRRG